MAARRCDAEGRGERATRNLKGRQGRRKECTLWSPIVPLSVFWWRSRADALFVVVDLEPRVEGQINLVFTKNDVEVSYGHIYSTTPFISSSLSPSPP